MERLTNAEEQIMQMLWDMERATVAQLIDRMPGERPPHSTISSIVRILERKGFVDHKAYGRTYEYFPVVSIDAYRKRTLRDVVSGYFEGSARSLVSFLADEGELSMREIDAIREMIRAREEEERTSRETKGTKRPDDK